MGALKKWSQQIMAWPNTPRRRIALVTCVMGLIWGAMVYCQGVRSPVHSADWSLMSEIGRRVALGDTLYVEAMDQKGPLCYATYALLWHIMHTQMGVFVLSNVLLWILLVASSGITARMVEDTRKPFIHPIAQALLVGVLFVPHVGCLEEWFAPFGLLCALWVRRLGMGRRVNDACWVVVGLAAAYTLWAKFTCAAQFAFLLCYAATREHTKGLGRAVLIALVSCAVASILVFLWVWFAGSFEGMMRHYVHAASDGYAGRMSMLGHIMGGNPSTTHVTSFFMGLPIALWATVMVARSVKDDIAGRVLVVSGAVILMACCFATFVGYYRFQLAPLAVVGACEITGEPWRLRPLRFIDEKIGIRYLLWAASALLVVCCTYYTCDGTSNMVKSAERLKKTLHEAVGESNSVVVWTFGNTWVYGELGLEFPYAIPARYNASQDVWEATAATDVWDHRWQYIVASVDNGGVEVGHKVSLDGKWYTVVAVTDGMAVADGDCTDEPLQNLPYRLP